MVLFKIMVTLHEDGDGAKNCNEDHNDDADGSVQEGQLVRLTDRWISSFSSSYIHQIILCIIPFIIPFYIHQVIH